MKEYKESLRQKKKETVAKLANYAEMEKLKPRQSEVRIWD